MHATRTSSLLAHFTVARRNELVPHGILMQDWEAWDATSEGLHAFGARALHGGQFFVSADDCSFSVASSLGKLRAVHGGEGGGGLKYWRG